MAQRQDDRRARHFARQFQEGDDRAGEGDRADGCTKAHLDAADGRDNAVRSGNAKALRREEGGSSHRDGGEADEAVEGGDELRHVRHGDAPRGDDADDRADGDGGEDEAYRHWIDRYRVVRQSAGSGDHGCMCDQRCHDRNRHADYAVTVACLAGGWRTQPAQCEDEEHPRDQIGEHRPSGGGRSAGRGMGRGSHQQGCQSKKRGQLDMRMARDWIAALRSQ